MEYLFSVLFKLKVSACGFVVGTAAAPTASAAQKTTERMNAICKYIASRSNRSVCVCCVLSELSWIMLRLTLSIRNRWASAHGVSLWCIYEMLTVIQCVKYIQSIFMISARVRRTHRARAFITASECLWSFCAESFLQFSQLNRNCIRQFRARNAVGWLVFLSFVSSVVAVMLCKCQR